MNNSLFTFENLLPRLRNEFNYPENGARILASKLINCNSIIQSAFSIWWEKGIIPSELEIEGYSIERLINEHGMKPIAAFLTLDWLLREPQKARQSLQKGHDQVKSRLK